MFYLSLDTIRLKLFSNYLCFVSGFFSQKQTIIISAIKKFVRPEIYDLLILLLCEKNDTRNRFCVSQNIRHLTTRLRTVFAVQRLKSDCSVHEFFVTRCPREPSRRRFHHQRRNHDQRCGPAVYHHSVSR